MQALGAHKSGQEAMLGDLRGERNSVYSPIILLN